MCHNRFTIQIDLFKYKRFKDGGCAYKNTGSSHRNAFRRESEMIPVGNFGSCFSCSGTFSLKGKIRN